MPAINTRLNTTLASRIQAPLRVCGLTAIAATHSSTRLCRRTTSGTLVPAVGDLVPEETRQVAEHRGCRDHRDHPGLRIEGLGRHHRDEAAFHEAGGDRKGEFAALLALSDPASGRNSRRRTWWREGPGRALDERPILRGGRARECAAPARVGSTPGKRAVADRVHLGAVVQVADEGHVVGNAVDHRELVGREATHDAGGFLFVEPVRAGLQSVSGVTATRSKISTPSSFALAVRPCSDAMLLALPPRFSWRTEVIFRPSGPSSRAAGPRQSPAIRSTPAGSGRASGRPNFRCRSRPRLPRNRRYATRLATSPGTISIGWDGQSGRLRR